MDFSKGFDVLPHIYLLEKLQYCGIKGPCLDWMNDFLKNRSQQVVVDGECSEEGVTSQVLQGSVSGPMLFLPFINYMPEHLNSKCQLFAHASILYIQRGEIQC